jgi:hypothetical protein
MKTKVQPPFPLSFAILACVTLAVTASTVFAATNSPINQSETRVSDNHRGDRRLGAYLGILGDPHPTVVGFNVAYNVLDYLRASAGFGKVTVSTFDLNDSGIGVTESSLTTFGVAGKFLVPGWNLSPAATVGLSFVSIDEGITATDYKSTNLYLGLGGDWQAASGFNLGAGLNLSLNGGAPTAPYINVGMFF